jgi:DNA-binding response OmpR family regulator
MRIGGVITHRVLVVEDDRDEASFLKTFLEAKGFTVALARDGGQAHSAFVMHRPDMVLLDLILPRESGYEVCERMKTLDPTVPIVMLTAIDFEDARDLARRVLADAYLTKPYDPEELVTQIHEVAERVWRRSKGIEETQDAEERVKFICPECGKHMRVRVVHRGRTVNCVNCGQPVVVPRHD